MRQNKIIFSFVLTFLVLVSIISTTSSVHATIYSSLTVGSRGQQVQELQQTLTSLGFYNGSVTGYFGLLTRAAVIKFQQAYNIFPQVGYFGPLTRNKLNQLFTAQPQPSPIKPITPTPSPITTGSISVDLKIDGGNGPISAAWNTSHILSWTVTGNPSSCIAGGNWSGSKNPNGGNEVVTVPSSISGAIGYYLTCSGVISNYPVVNIVEPAFLQYTRPEPAASASDEISGNTITSCGMIKRSGNYMLGNDISSKGMTCLTVRDLSQVYIDCNNHSISMDLQGQGNNNPVMYMKNVNNFSLKSCSTKITNNTISWPATVLFISRSTNGVISNNNFSGGDVGAEDITNLQVSRNTFVGGYGVRRGHSNIAEDNVFDPPRKYDAGSAPLEFSFGSNNRLSRNIIDGKSDGIFQNKLGYDDGIVIQDENQDVIEGNDLKNFWDCGIETSGFVRNTQIIGNKIKNAPICGIGGWYWNSWKSNTVAQNVVDTVGTLFRFLRNYGLRPNDNYIDDTYVYFKDNIFRDNILLNPNSVQSSVSSSFVMNQQSGPLSEVGSRDGSERQAASSDFVTGNNQFINNDFGKVQGAPLINPYGMTINGGGNKCGQIPSTDYPLKCN